MRLLALDTCTEACSAALYLDGEVRERYELTRRDHAGLILPMIDGLLAEAGLSARRLDALAFGRGPGSFTGVRIGVAVAQGIAWGADLPVVPVSTLAALAWNAFAGHGADHAYPAIDARMGEVYWAVYRRAPVPELTGSEAVLPPAAVAVPAGTCGIAVGSGWLSHGEILHRAVGDAWVATAEDHYPRASAVARIGAALAAAGQMVGAEAALPVYLRERVADRPRTAAPG